MCKLKIWASFPAYSVNTTTVGMFALIIMQRHVSQSAEDVSVTMASWNRDCSVELLQPEMLASLMWQRNFNLKSPKAVTLNLSSKFAMQYDMLDVLHAMFCLPVRAGYPIITHGHAASLTAPRGHLAADQTC